MPSNTDNPPRPRGRPRTFDPAVAAERIIETFWTRGFAGTSLDHIAAATGMHRPSLYGAFGDKKQMYRSALETFAAMMRREAAVTLSAPRLADALSAFYRSAIAQYVGGPDGPRGCLFVCTAAVECAQDSEVRADLANVLKEIDAVLTERIRLAQAEQDLDRELDATAAGRLAAAVLHSLAVRARAGEPARQLDALADSAVELIAGASAKAS